MALRAKTLKANVIVVKGWRHELVYMVAAAIGGYQGNLFQHDGGRDVGRCEARGILWGLGGHFSGNSYRFVHFPTIVGIAVYSINLRRCAYTMHTSLAA